MPLPTTLAVGRDLDRIAGLEVALDGGDPDRQQARAALAQDPRGALVDEHAAVGGLRVLEPELEARGLAAPRRRSGCRRPLRRRRRASVPAAVPLQITAGMPASLAISAAATLLRIPPEPKADVRSPISRPLERGEVVDLDSTSSAPGSARGSAVWRPSTSVSRTSRRASSRIATWAARKSLSPKVISSVAVVSFSLTTGHHPPLDQPAQGLAGVQVVGAGGDVGGGEQHLRGVGAAARPAAPHRRGRGRPGRPRRPPAARPSPAGGPAAPSAACRARSRPR